MVSTCSDQFITYEPDPVGAGGGTVTKYSLATEQAAARSQGAKARSTMGEVALLRYTETRSWRAKVKDAAGLDECCKLHPDQCSRRYIGVMVEGEGGEVLTAYDRNSGAKAKSKDARALVQDGWEWVVSKTFPRPVYFAFRLTTRAGGDLCATCECKPWTKGLVPTGHVVAIGLEAQSEQEALRNARLEGVRQVLEKNGVKASFQELKGELKEYRDGSVLSEGQGAAREKYEFRGVVVDLATVETCVEARMSDRKLYLARVLMRQP